MRVFGPKWTVGCQSSTQYIKRDFSAWQHVPLAVDLTDTFGSSGAWLKPVVALAAVASHRVDAAPVLADARLGAALIQVFPVQGKEIEEVHTSTMTGDIWCRLEQASHIALKHFYSPIHPSPSGLRCMPGGQIHMKVPIRFLQVIPLESQSSSPSEHSSWSG